MYKVYFKISDNNPIEYESDASLAVLYKTGTMRVRYAHRNHTKIRYIVSDMTGAPLLKFYCRPFVDRGWIARLSGIGKYARHCNGITYREG